MKFLIVTSKDLFIYIYKGSCICVFESVCLSVRSIGT